MPAFRFAVVLLALALTGCPQADAFLVVDFATDLEAGTRFIAIETELSRDSEPVAEHLEVARLGDSFIEPIRLTSFEGLTPALYRLRVALTDVAGEVVVERSFLVRVDGAAAVTAVLSGLCEGVRCPADGDPAELTTCVGGLCVDPRCSDEAPEFCPAGCDGDDDCPGGGVCVAQVCLGGSPADCDDDDPCTDDALIDDACVYTPNTSGCDDGVFCNGPDTCLDGECAVHGTPPCAADRCAEATRTCDTGCVTDADCPDPVIGDWSACDGFASICAREGTRARTVTRFACEAGRCVADPIEETEACTQDTDGDACGSAGCDDWSECRFSACQTEGQRVRLCRDPVCAGGECDQQSGYESEPCSRPPVEGTTCSPSGSFCQGVCRSGDCTELCEYCGGVCTIVGCRTGSC